MHRSSPTGFVGKGSDHLQLIKFWQSGAPGKGSSAGKFLNPPYYSQRAVFASLPSAFFIGVVIITSHRLSPSALSRTRSCPANA